MSETGSSERVSLRHVAERAGVSVKTVSNVVNQYVHVSDGTRARVQQAIDDLHYRPDLAARKGVRRTRSWHASLGLWLSVGLVALSATGLRPGATQTRCITVTSTGSAASLVKLYGTGKTTTKSLSTYLTLVVSAGSGGSSASCAGFVPASTVYRGTLNAFPTSYAAGVGSWSPAGGAAESTTYQITYSLSASAPAAAQTGTAAVAFTWEAQNT